MLKQILKKILPSFIKKLISQFIVFFRKRLYELLFSYDCNLCIKLIGFKKYEVVFLDSIKNIKTLRDKAKSTILPQ
mgnify:CR=1 FL=1